MESVQSNNMQGQPQQARRAKLKKASYYGKQKTFALVGAMLTLLCTGSVNALENSFKLPRILSDADVRSQHYLPDYSYAGYANGERQPDTSKHKVIKVADHKIIANDGLDDSQALIRLLNSIRSDDTPTILQFENGRYIISSIIYFDRNNLVVRGSGTGSRGTEFYFPRPLIYTSKAPELAELNEYLVALNKIQKEKQNNIYLPFTE